MRNFTIVIVFLCLLFAKAATAQLVIAKPNLGFSQACASASFNTYNITFAFSPSTALLPTNQFIVELSDENGSFASPTVVYTSAQGAITTSPATLSFSLPITTSGEAYKVRVKSTAPAATSGGSDSFPAYYKIQDTPFTINNLVETAVYCSGSSYLLTIDNPGFGNNDSPLQYPSLSFNWYKEIENTTSSVLVGTGENFSVTEPGTYYAETNYGTCTSNSFSNRVTISVASSDTTTSISSSLGNPYCSSEGATTLSTINGQSYQWYKDGTMINGATGQMYETNEAGDYSVTVDLGNCTATASITLENTGFSSSIDVPDSIMLNEGETVVATVTTDAVSPEFEWYLNDTIINGETGNSYQVSQAGNYRVVIRQTSGCIASSEFTFAVIEAFPNVANIPNLISPNGDGINDTWVIPQEYVAGTNTEVIIISSQGEVVLQTNDYQNNWPIDEINFKDINPVYYYIITTQNNKTKKGSITVVK